MTRMRSLAFLVPGRLEDPTGGYVYDRRMIEGLRAQGWSVEVTTLDASFPNPTAAALDHAAQVLADLPAGTRVLVDGLAWGAMPDLAESEASRLRFAALVHLPLAADITRDPAARARLAASERRALRVARVVVVTGPQTPGLLAPYLIPSDRIAVVEPGTTRVPIARRAETSRVTLLCVATLHPGKGHEQLLQALASLDELDWRLVCAGSLTRHPATAERVRSAIARCGFADRVALAGELDETAIGHCYDTADVFVSATLQETYGMAVAEAVMHGLPVVATATGAIPHIVAQDAGLVVAPGDTPALRGALRRIIADGAVRAALTAGAVRARDRLPTWEQASRRLADALRRLDA